MEPQQRRTVLDLLGVRVTVTGWECCEACGGRGKTKGGKGGLRCRACHGMRRVPVLQIDGVVLDALDVGDLGGAVSRRRPCSTRFCFRVEAEVSSRRLLPIPRALIRGQWSALVPWLPAFTRHSERSDLRYR